MPQPRPRGRPKAFHDKTEQNTIRSLDRAMEILKAVSDADGLTLTQLAEDTDQSPATVYRVLTTLAAHQIVEVEPETQLWRVGSGAFQIGSTFLRQTNLVEQSRPEMARLMRETGETANIGVEKEDEVLFLSQVETYEAIRGFFPPGTRSPMHASGIGKALLAYLPDERLAKIIAKTGLPGFTDLTLKTETALRTDLALVRQLGYAVDDQEKADGMRCVAAPIFNHFGEPVAGISVSGPAFRMSLSETPKIGEKVRDAASRITAALGG